MLALIGIYPNNIYINLNGKLHLGFIIYYSYHSANKNVCQGEKICNDQRNSSWIQGRNNEANLRNKYNCNAGKVVLEENRF